jgi:hypothetical protein
MSNQQQIIQELIDKPRWTNVLKRFMDVLRVNILLVDFEGRLVILPYEEGDPKRYGFNLLQQTFHFDFTGKDANLLKDFVSHDSYLECKDAFDFHAFAIPITVEEEKIIAYLVVGPVILHKKWPAEEYPVKAAQWNIDSSMLLNEIQDLRIVSYVTIKAVLDLLSAVVKDIIHLNLEKKRLHQTRFNKQLLPKEVLETAQEIFSTIHIDEMLVTMLDVALTLANAECGSIMMFDKERGHLTIKVSRGIDEDRVRKTRVKLGEGISGLAAQENCSFVITGEKSDNRLKTLIKRQDIRQSAIIPLAVKNRVFGVMNIHTKKDEGKIEENAQNIKNLSRLISSAILSTASQNIIA